VKNISYKTVKIRIITDKKVLQQMLFFVDYRQNNYLVLTKQFVRWIDSTPNKDQAEGH
jgi:hypothetical protein